MKRSTTSAKRKTVQWLLAAGFWLAVWQLASAAMGELFLSSPLTVLKTLAALVREPAFWRTVALSLSRVAAGFGAALAVGVVTAAAAARLSLVRALTAPFISLIKTVPVASFIILLLIWLRSSEWLSACVSFLMVLPIIYTNTLSGIDGADGLLLEVAQVFAMPAGRRVIAVYLPAVLPQLFAGCRVALGLAWKSGIAAEVIGLPGGSIGERLYQSKIFWNTGELFAWTAVIIAASVLFERLALRLLDIAARRLAGGELP